MKVSALVLSIACAISWNSVAWADHTEINHNTRLIAASAKDIVIYNTKSDKYHIPSCSAAKRCTVNCIPLTRGEAKRRGGVPCKLCGAGE